MAWWVVQSWNKSWTTKLIELWSSFIVSQWSRIWRFWIANSCKYYPMHNVHGTYFCTNHLHRLWTYTLARIYAMQSYTYLSLNASTQICTTHSCVAMKTLAAVALGGRGLVRFHLCKGIMFKVRKWELCTSCVSEHCPHYLLIVCNKTWKSANCCTLEIVTCWSDLVAFGSHLGHFVEYEEMFFFNVRCLLKLFFFNLFLYVYENLTYLFVFQNYATIIEF